MPYIKQEFRTPYYQLINSLLRQLHRDKFNVGIVTYVIYKIVYHMFLHNKCYQTIAEIRGVLSGTADEFNRRMAHPYEDEKVIENGDVE